VARGRGVVGRGCRAERENRIPGAWRKSIHGTGDKLCVPLIENTISRGID